MMRRGQDLLHVMGAVSQPADRMLHDSERAVEVLLAEDALDIDGCIAAGLLLGIHRGIIGHTGRLVGG